MTQESVGFLATYLSSVFKYFTDWAYPGTFVTPAVFIFGSFCLFFVWKTLRKILNSNDGGDSD